MKLLLKFSSFTYLSQKTIASIILLTVKVLQIFVRDTLFSLCEFLRGNMNWVQTRRIPQECVHKQRGIRVSLFLYRMQTNGLTNITSSPFLDFSSPSPHIKGEVAEAYEHVLCRGSK